MPPKIPRAWPQDVARHLALYDHIHGTEEAAKYAAESAGHSSEELQPSPMDSRIGELAEMREAAKNRRRGLLQKGQLDAPMESAKASTVEASSEVPGGSEDSWVGFMPSLPPSTFKKLFGASKARAKAK